MEQICYFITLKIVRFRQEQRDLTTTDMIQENLKSLGPTPTLCLQLYYEKTLKFIGRQRVSSLAPPLRLKIPSGGFV